MTESRGSAFTNILRFVSVLLQIGILISLAVLVAEVEQYRNRDAENPLLVAIRPYGSKPVRVAVDNLSSDPIPVRVDPSPTPTVVVYNGQFDPLYVTAV